MQPQEDGDIYLAGMLAIKLYVNLLEDPETAFCDLYSNLENHKGGLISDEILTLVTFSKEYLTRNHCPLLLNLKWKFEEYWFPMTGFPIWGWDQKFTEYNFLN